MPLTTGTPATMGAGVGGFICWRRRWMQGEWTIILAQTLAANALAYRELCSGTNNISRGGFIEMAEEETRADGRADDGGKVAERWRR